MPYIQQVHFGVQHQFAGFVADVAYVWTKGTHLAFMYDLNQVPADLLGPGNMQVNRPYPQFSTIFDAAHEGLSKYNALQATLRRQYGQGLTLDLNYTWSKCMDTGSSSGWGYDSVDSWQTGSIAANYGLCLSDRPQMFNGGLVYELPFGRGKPFLKQGGLANAVVGGWRIASIFQVSSGIPFTVAMPNNFSGNLGYSWWLPNRIGSGKLSHPTTNEWFDTSDFVQPAPYTLGNSGRDILFGPNYRTLNFSLAKEFAIPPLGEDARLQLRADAINVTNHTNFGMPDRGVGDLNEGVISSVFTGATSANRVIQLGVRLTF